VKIYEACSRPVLLEDTIDIIERTRFAFFFAKSKNHRCDPDNDPDDGDDAPIKFHALLRTPKPRAEIWPNGSGHPGEVAGKFRHPAADGEIGYASRHYPAIDSGDLIKMATTVPAQIARLDASIGELSVSKKADFVIVNAKPDPNARNPVFDPVAKATPADVVLVVVAGR